MNDVKWLSPREISTATRNLEEIQKYLGHPIPGGMINPVAYKDTFLTPGECMTVARNIEAMEKSQSPQKVYTSRQYHEQDSRVSLTGFAMFLGAVFIIVKIANYIIMMR